MSRSLGIGEGYATWTDKESGKVTGEAKTIGCAHCQRLIVFHTETGQRIDRGSHRSAPRSTSHDPGGFCPRCADPKNGKLGAICGPCADEMSRTDKCKPFEQRLEEMEGKHRFLQVVVP